MSTRICVLLTTILFVSQGLFAQAPQAKFDDSGSTESSIETITPDSVGLTVKDEIDVLEDLPTGPTIVTLSSEELPEMSIGDGADLLRAVSGVTVGRMGGHGLEPRIRGLGESSLNVMVDGAYVHGGCPNRMDPPSSFATPNTFDEVTVIKGVQSLRFGPGGSAGTVLFERSLPVITPPETWKAEVLSSYGSWHTKPELGLDAALVKGAFCASARAV